METENLTKEEPVGSPAPKNVKAVYHNFNSPTNNELSDDEMEDAANGQDDDDSTYESYSSSSSPTSLSSSENSINSNTPTSEPDVHTEDNSNYNSSFSSPVRLSNSENPINSPIFVHKEDEEKGNFSSNTSDNSAYSSSSSTPVRSSKSANLISAFIDEHGIIKEGQEKGNSVNDTTLDSNENEMEKRGQEDDNSTDMSSSSSPVGLSNSLNSMNVVLGEKNIQKEDNENETEIRGPEGSNPTAFSSSSSAAGLSNSLNSINVAFGELDTQKEDNENGNFVNDSTLSSTVNDLEIIGPKEGNFTNSSSPSSPVGLSHSLNLINVISGEPDIHRKDNKNCNSTKTDTEIRGQEEGNYTDMRSSSPVGLSNSLNSNNVVSGEQNIKKGIYVNDEILRLTVNETEIICPEDGISSAAGISNSPNSINVAFGELDTLKEDNEMGNFVNDATLSSTANDMEIKGPKEGKFTNISSSFSPVGHSNSLNSINVISGEPDISRADNKNCNSLTTDTEITGQEEGNYTYMRSSSPVGISNSLNSNNVVSGEQNIKKGIYVNEEILRPTVSETEIICPEDGISSAAGISSSPNSINVAFGELDTLKEDNEMGNFVNDATLSSTANDMEIIGPKEGKFTNISSSSSPVGHSNSLNSINVISGEPDINRADNKNCNSITTDIEITGQEEGNSTVNSSSSSPVLVSTSENLINGLSREPDVQKEVHEKGNIVNYTVEQGNILDCDKDIEDREKPSESNIVDHQSAESAEMKAKDADLNDQKGITLNSSFDETKTDDKENTCNNEKRLVLYASREPNTAAWSKFLKFKSLYTVSNIFRRLKDENLREKESPEVKPGWSPRSLIRISDEDSSEALEFRELIAIKGRIVLYTKLSCKDCKEARKFLRNKKLRYSEINIDLYPCRKTELEQMTGSLHVPKVFFNEVLIGGLNELKGMDESGELDEKIEFIKSEEPTPKAPLPPFSGEDDVSSRGIVDELAIIVRKMKESVVVKDRFYKFRRVTNCFRGSEAVDFLSEDQFLERAEAIEFGRKLAKELFFRHALEENFFEDGNHPYRFLDQDPVISQCQNIPRGIIELKRQSLVELSHRLRFLLYAILDAYTSEDGKHIAYRTIHGSEEFARYLRIAEELQRLDLNRTPKEERLAFFINLYNMMAIHAILVWGHPERASDRRKLLNDFKYVIGGCAYSLSDIYNGVLRSNQRPPYTLIKPFGITDKRFKVSLPYPEPLIHFALVFGNRSAPALRCYSPNNIDRELMDAARDFLKSGAFVLDLDSKTVSVTKILRWYSVDFGRNDVEVLKHAANYLDVETTQTLLELLDSTQLKVVYQPYDWRLNS